MMISLHKWLDYDLLNGILNQKVEINEFFLLEYISIVNILLINVLLFISGIFWRRMLCHISMDQRHQRRKFGKLQLH